MRFTIRDLLWLTVVVGLACGWWISLAKQRAEWRSERDKNFAQWRKESDGWLALLTRMNTALYKLKLPTEERQELLRTIYNGVEAPHKQRSATPSDP